MVLSFEKKYKKKPSQTVHQSMRGSSQVESWNAEMVKVGSGNNNSCQLMDSKLMDEATLHNLKRISLIKGYDKVPSTDVLKKSCIRHMLESLQLPDKYIQVPKPDEMPEVADPVGFEAMCTGLDPADTDMLLTGDVSACSACMSMRAMPVVKCCGCWS